MPMVATPGPGPPFAGGAEAATGVSAAAAVAASAAPTGAFAAAVGFRSSLLASVMAAICFGSIRVNSGLYGRMAWRSEEHTSELQSLMRISYAVFCLKKKKHMT